MNYQIQSDNMDLSPSMTELAKDKLRKLEKHFKDYPDDTITARVVLNKAPDDTFEVKIKFGINGKEIFAEKVNYSLESALVVVIEDLDKQLEKERSKHRTEKEWNAQRDQKRASEDLLEKESATDDELLELQEPEEEETVKLP